MVAKQQEAEARLPSVFPEEFYHKYAEQEDGTTKATEWVLVTKRGMSNPQRTPMRWKDVERTPDLLKVLKPFYENWKSGQSAPVVGTPLEAWIADAALVKVLNAVNIRSVEEFAELEEHLLVKLNVPNIREKKKRAVAFLEVQKSTSKVSAEVATLRSEKDFLRKELDELKSLINAQSSPSVQTPSISVEPPPAAPAKRGPGRPRKVQEAA